jgi:ABC-type transporter Mla maintaining outer membrane lipid asymmetry ATPase subunit MlaF
VLYDATAGLDPVTSQTIISRPALAGILRVTALLATHRLQDLCLANFHFDTASHRVVPNSEKRAGERPEGESATRFAVLRDGKVFFKGSPDEMAAAKDPYLKRFLV